MCHQLFTAITRTWLKRLFLLLLTAVLLTPIQNLYCETPKVQKLDGAYVLKFDGAVLEPRGFVQVGDTITILYWLRITRGSKRFIAMDTSSMPKGAFSSVDLTLTPIVGTGKWAGGFLIRDSASPQLDVSISPKLWEKVKDVPTRQQLHALEETMSRYANLQVRLGKTGTHYKIIGVSVN